MRHKEETDVFSNIDKGILQHLLSRLEDEERIAIYLRYWEKYLIQEVAQVLHRSWSYTDQLIEKSIKKLRIEFFRSKLSVLQKAA